MILFLRGLYAVMHLYFTIAVRLDAASKTARRDWRDLAGQVKTWAVPNPHSSLVYRSRHSTWSRCRCGKPSCSGRRTLRAATQEVDVRRILRAFEVAGAASLTGEIRRVSA